MASPYIKPETALERNSVLVARGRLEFREQRIAAATPDLE
jgi:hypothetical protein